MLGLASLTLCACGSRPAPPDRPPGRPGGADEGAYRAPPSIEHATRDSDGGVALEGWAEPGARVRLASPTAQAIFADAAADGAWRMRLASLSEPRLFGLSMADRGRAVQAEGYVLIGPGAETALLRAGAGALVLDGPARLPVILSVDWDSKGGTVVSGRAAPRAAVELSIDGKSRARTVSATDGRFSIPLDEPPLALGEHRLVVTADGGRDDITASLVRAEPVRPGPYRAMRAPRGWKIDWLTPGGGVQSTLLIERTGGAS